MIQKQCRMMIQNPYRTVVCSSTGTNVIRKFDSRWLIEKRYTRTRASDLLLDAYELIVGAAQCK